MLIFDCSKRKNIFVYVSHDVVDQASTGTKHFQIALKYVYMHT